MEGFAMDRLQALIHLEQFYYGCCLPMEDSEPPPATEGMHEGFQSQTSLFTSVARRGTYLTVFPESRSKIACWAYDVVDHFGFPRQAVSWMMYYLDRMLPQQTTSGKEPTTRDFLRLAVASFHLAIKLACKPSSHVFPLLVMLDMAKNQFTAAQITETEYDILQGLRWRVHPPTADQFVTILIEICCWRNAARREQIQDYASYLIELSVLYDCFLFSKPSELAIAALFVASDWIGSQGQVCAQMAHSEHTLGMDDQMIHAFFALDPLEVMHLVVDYNRVSDCRQRLSQILRLQMNHTKSTTDPWFDAHLESTRMQSPVSVTHPNDNRPVVLQNDGSGSSSADARMVLVESVPPPLLDAEEQSGGD